MKTTHPGGNTMTGNGRLEDYLTKKSHNFLFSRGFGLPTAINTTVARYDLILRNTSLPVFTESEMATMANAIMGSIYEPAEMISGLWQGIEDEFIDELPDNKDLQSLIEKMKTLSLTQEVVLLDQLEQLLKQNN